MIDREYVSKRLEEIRELPLKLRSKERLKLMDEMEIMEDG